MSEQAQQRSGADDDQDRAAKRQKTSESLVEESNKKEADTKCCKICEAELGEEDNGGEGYTCSNCYGDCEVDQVCTDCLCD